METSTRYSPDLCTKPALLITCYNNSKQIQISSAYNGMGISVSHSTANDRSQGSAGHQHSSRRVTQRQGSKIRINSEILKQNMAHMELYQDINREADKQNLVSHYNKNLAVATQKQGELRNPNIEQQLKFATLLISDDAKQLTCLQKQIIQPIKMSWEVSKQAAKGVEKKINPSVQIPSQIFLEQQQKNRKIKKGFATVQLKRPKNASWLTLKKDSLSSFIQNDQLNIQLNRLSLDQFELTAPKAQIQQFQARPTIPSINLILSRKCAENIRESRQADPVSSSRKQPMRQIFSDKGNTISESPKHIINFQIQKPENSRFNLK